MVTPILIERVELSLCYSKFSDFYEIHASNDPVVTFCVEFTDKTCGTPNGHHRIISGHQRTTQICFWKLSCCIYQFTFKLHKDVKAKTVSKPKLIKSNVYFTLTLLVRLLRKQLKVVMQITLKLRGCSPFFTIDLKNKQTKTERAHCESARVSCQQNL